jgi:hypothetical protein
MEVIASDPAQGPGRLCPSDVHQSVKVSKSRLTDELLLCGSSKYLSEIHRVLPEFEI